MRIWKGRYCCQHSVQTLISCILQKLPLIHQNHWFIKPVTLLAAKEDKTCKNKALFCGTVWMTCKSTKRLRWKFCKPFPISPFLPLPGYSSTIQETRRVPPFPDRWEALLSLTTTSRWVTAMGYRTSLFGRWVWERLGTGAPRVRPVEEAVTDSYILVPVSISELW